METQDDVAPHPADVNFDDVELDVLGIDDTVMIAGHGLEAPGTPPVSPMSEIDDDLIADLEAPILQAAEDLAVEAALGDELPDLDEPLRAAAAAADPSGGTGAGSDRAENCDPDQDTIIGMVSAVNRLWDQAVAQSVGDRSRQVQMTEDGKLTTSKRKGLSHPETRTFCSIQRLSVLKQPPGTDDCQGNSSYIDSQVLAKTTAETEINKKMGRVWHDIQLTGKTPSGDDWLTLSRSGDETCFVVRLSPAEMKVWMEWMLRKLEANKYLKEEDVKKLAGVLKCRNIGLVHLLSQHLSIRWDGGNDDNSVRDVPTKVCAVQRTSASNYGAAMDKFPGEKASVRYFLARVAPFLKFSLINLTSDEGSGPVRYAKEVVDACEPVDNVGVNVSFCKEHVLGNSAGDALECCGCLSFMVRWSKLIRQFECYNAWTAGQQVVAVRKIGSNILHVSPGSFAAEVAASDEFLDRLGEVTLFREEVTQACAHPLEPDTLAAEAKEKIEQTKQRLTEMWTKLKRLVHIVPRDYKRGSHLCFGPSTCGSYCDAGSWTILFGAAYSEICVELTPHGMQVAKTRFLSYIKLLPLAHLGIFLNEVGPDGWLEEYSIPRMEKEYANNMRQQVTDDAGQFQRDQTVRFHGCSRKLDDPDFRVFLVIANICLIALDRLFRYMDRASARANRGKYPPLLFQVVQTNLKLNPLWYFYRDHCKQLLEDSHLTWALRVFYDGHGRVPAFFWKHAWTALVFLIELLSHVKAKFGLVVAETNPFITWQIASEQHYHGVSSPRALWATHRALAVPKCCVDEPLSDKVLGRPIRKSAATIVTSTEMKCCRCSGHDMFIANLDEERSLSGVRRICFRSRARSLTSASNSEYCQQIRVQHERRGFTTTCGRLTSKEIRLANLRLLERRQSRTIQGAAPGAMSAWALYYKEVVAVQWREAQERQQSLRLFGGQTRRSASTKKAYRQGKGKNAEIVWIKGLNSWETWTTHFKKAVLRFQKSHRLTKLYKAKAIQWNLDHPRTEMAFELPAQKTNADTFWGIGSPTEPIRVDLMEETANAWVPELPESHPGARRQTGPVRTARGIAKAQEGELLVEDPRLPSEKLPELKYDSVVCFYLHGGLCRTADAPIYEMVKKICCNLNTVCTLQKPRALLGRTLRLDFLMRGRVAPIVCHKHADLFLGHIRLQRPQVQIVAPVKQRQTTRHWHFIWKDDSVYIHTSYHQVKVSVYQLLRLQDWKLEKIWLHELSLAPTVALGNGIAELEQVPADVLGLAPLFTDPPLIYPGALPRSRRKRAEARAPSAEAAPAGADDEFGIEAAFALQQAMEKKREETMAALMEKFRRAHMGFPDPKKRGGTKRNAAGKGAGKGGGKGGGKGAGKKGAGKNGGDDADDEGDAAPPSGDEGSDDGEGGPESDAPMDWEEAIWEDEEGGDPVMPAGGAAERPYPDGPGQAPLFPAPVGPGAAAPSHDAADHDSDQDGDGAGAVAPGGADGGAAAAAAPREVDRIIGRFGTLGHRISLVVPTGLPNECATGVRIQCDRHADSADVRPAGASHWPCARSLNLTSDETGWNLEECKHLLKSWVLAGYHGVRDCRCPEIVMVHGDAPTGCNARRHHMAIKPRSLRANPPSHVLDQLIADGHFTADELVEFRD